MQAEIRLRKKRGFGDIISTSFDYLKVHWKKLLKYVILTILPIYVLGGFVMASGSTSFAGINTGTVDTVGIILRIYGGLFIIMGGFVMMTWMVVEYMRLSLKLNKEEITYRKVMGGLKKSLGYYILGSILVGIITSVSFMFFFIPAIYFGVVFSIFFFALGVERIDPGAAISRSFELIRGHWWYTFLLFFPVGIIQAAIAYSLHIPFHALLFAQTYFGFETGEFNTGLAIIMAISGAAGAIIGSITQIYPVIACGVNYFSLVEYREELGLKERIEAITVENEM